MREEIACRCSELQTPGFSMCCNYSTFLVCYAKLELQGHEMKRGENVNLTVSSVFFAKHILRGQFGGYN